MNLRLSSLASVKLAIATFAAILVCILAGAWCPQESQIGFERVVETFGEYTAFQLHALGITDIFHSPLFLGLIGVLTVNMIACSFQRVFPKLRLYQQPIAFMSNKEIVRFPINKTISLKASAEAVLQAVQARFKKQGYTIRTNGSKVTGEWGKFGRIAASITHVGLLLLLVGVTITSWTGFTGFKPVLLGKALSFADSEHSKQWLGKLPDWTVRVDATRREDYRNGDAKQWYSTLSVISPQGVVLKKQEISVNNPLEYDGVDIYQSSWGVDSIAVAFNGQHPQVLKLQQMGATQAAFLPLDSNAILIFSLRKHDASLRVFGKTPECQQPKMLAEIPPGKTVTFGAVPVTYIGPIPVTGLQYKSDPGLPITYFAFSIIILGVSLAAVPHSQIWMYVGEGSDGTATLYMGGVSKKAKRAFEKSIAATAAALIAKYGEAPAIEAPESSSPPEQVEVLSLSNVSSPEGA